jgi:flagellar P-ring protein precursor FlgI
MNNDLLVDILISHESPLSLAARRRNAAAQRLFSEMAENHYVKEADAFFPTAGAYAMPARGSLSTLIGDTPALSTTPSPYSIDAVLSKCIFTLFLFITAMVVVMSFAPDAKAEARLKDIASFEGVRDNLLMGYGLVVGLNGTGDKLKNNEFTNQSLIAFLERQGINTRGVELKSKNIAAVTVTATLPAFARTGSRLNVSVSAMGDARSLQGGILLATVLYGADGEVYVVAQGPVSIAGFEAGGGGTTVTKGVPTNGFIADGGIIEREINFELNKMASLNIGLRNPDISTAKHIAEAINRHLGVDAAEMTDPGTVHLRVPIDFKDNTAKLLAEIEQLPVQTDQIAKVVIDEASGTVVMGENVRIDTVAVAQGNLVVKVEETPQVSQPAPLAPNSAQTVVAPVTTVSVEESKSKMTILQHGATLRDLVAGLNALGVGPRDLITILQTIKSAGALEAEIIAK